MELRLYIIVALIWFRHSGDLSAPASSQSAASADPTAAAAIARGEQMVGRARASLGQAGDIKSLSFSGKVRRHYRYLSVQSPYKAVERQKTVTGTIGMDFVFPDRIRYRVRSHDVRGFPFGFTETVNADDAWREPPLPVHSSRRDGHVIDVRDYEQSEEIAAQDARQNIALFTLGLLLREVPGLPLTFSYAGTYNAGFGTANAVLVTGLGDISVYLLLHPEDCHPLGLAAAPLVPKQIPVLVEAASFDRAFMEDTRARAARERQARREPPRRAELHWIFSEHQRTEGFLLPRRVSITLDGALIEEVDIADFKVNAPFDPARFERPRK